ncbi:MAG TPA: hypothetical protein VI603_06105 [Saprospiraceae bacterium]|nr:hypothetical protein [Saprospiraceae bacterium]
MKHLPKSPSAKTLTQIADEYGIDVRTLKKKLALAGIKPPHGLILPKDQERIYKALGPPF